MFFAIQLIGLSVSNSFTHWDCDFVSILQEAIIGGLQSETTYSVTVAAYTTKGDGARSKAKVITTTGAGQRQFSQGYPEENSVLYAYLFTGNTGIISMAFNWGLCIPFLKRTVKWKQLVMLESHRAICFLQCCDFF